MVWEFGCIGNGQREKIKERVKVENEMWRFPLELFNPLTCSLCNFNFFAVLSHERERETNDIIVSLI